MSIEFFGRPTPALTEIQISALWRDIPAAVQCHVVRIEDEQLGLRFLDAENEADESFTVSFAPNEVYVGFHVGTGQQRQHILGMMRQFLASQGISCDFEEA